MPAGYNLSDKIACVVSTALVHVLAVHLLDIGEDILEYDPDTTTPTQLESDDSDLNQDLLESDGTYIVMLARPKP